ncbi:hypothetical protein [Nitrosopumilus sp. Nsub]|uniref:hypothetical protein n=1 Tax=Nitrosopumilus sp. Nsub TaxID=1776294 RepID=UPI0008332A91|nr:hypothetical protein [Nitrosopumilus sp. Nsub]
MIIKKTIGTKAIVSTITQEKNGKKYLYLKHSTGNRQKEQYLGLVIPENVNEIEKKICLNFTKKNGMKIQKQYL